MKQKAKNYHDKYDWFYQSKYWKDLRNQKFYDADGLCELCRKEGIVKQAKEVHHIVPIEEDFSKALDYDNLIALCDEHHRQQHERDSSLQKFFRFWDKL